MWLLDTTSTSNTRSAFEASSSSSSGGGHGHGSSSSDEQRSEWLSMMIRELSLSSDQTDRLKRHAPALQTDRIQVRHTTSSSTCHIITITVMIRPCYVRDVLYDIKTDGRSSFNDE
jgi:hypothetical protein